MEGEKHTTKLICINENGRYEIEVNAIGMTYEDFIDDLIVPLSKAVGYYDSTIEKYIPEQ